jgi:hypothetical protein
MPRVSPPAAIRVEQGSHRQFHIHRTFRRRSHHLRHAERAEWFNLSVKGIEERALGHLPAVAPISEVCQNPFKLPEVLYLLSDVDDMTESLFLTSAQVSA